MKIVQLLVLASLLLIAKIDTASCQYVQNSNSSDSPMENEMNNPYSLASFQKGYYIVAGVFNMYNNANSFYLQLKEKVENPLILTSSLDQKIYVCLAYSESIAPLKKELMGMRKMNGLEKAWLLKITDDKEIKVSEKPESSIQKTYVANAVKSRTRDITKTHNNYKLYVNVHDGNGKSILSQVAIINGEKATMVSSVSSNTLINFNYPKAETQTVQLSCEAFGFHKTVFDLKLNDPVNETTLRFVKKSGDTIIVDMPLKKYQRGDVMVMYNIFFFSNSNAIHLKSNYELQRVLDLFKENPMLKIKIHGHTNGRSLGKIIKVNEDLFSMQEHIVTYGTAKTLSKLRSNAIQKYLAANGISKDRIKIKGWGGRRMIHPEHSPLADYNLRVEIEVLED